VKSDSEPPIKTTTRSLAGVRETLLQELDDLRSGRSSTEQAKAVAMLAATALKTIDVQLKYAVLVNSGVLAKADGLPSVALEHDRKQS
jgi:hypothetical protein